MSVYVKQVNSDPVFSAGFTDRLSEAIDRILDEKNLSGGEVGVVIADDSMLQRLNRDYRDQDVSTDVLSFSYIEPPGSGTPDETEFAVGDIYISLDRAREQANRAGHSLEREIFLLTVHGLLHILGFDHGEDSDARLMEEQEKLIMEKYDLDPGGER